VTNVERTGQINGNVRSTAVLLKLWLVAVLAVAVVGCSTRFLYNQLDTFIVWKVGDFVTLTAPQKDELKAQLSSQLEYVRQNDLPRTAAVLTAIAGDVEGGEVSAAMLDDYYAQMLVLYDDFMLGIVPVSAWFLSSLSDEQIAEMFANFEELNQEMYEDYSGRTAEERQENRDKSALKVTKRFTGRLDAEQKLLITDSLASMEDASEQWIEYQRQWQLKFRDLVENQPPPDEFRAELTSLFVYPRNLHSAEYRATVDGNRLIFNTMMSELLTGLSAKQRARAVDKLEGYAKLLTKLSQGS